MRIHFKLIELKPVELFDLLLISEQLLLNH